MATTPPTPARPPFSPGIQRATALSGVAFALLLIATIALGGAETPAFDDPVADWSGWADENRDASRYAALAFALATYAFALYLGWLRSELGRAEDAARGFTRGGYVVIIGGIIGVAGLMFGIAVSAVAPFRPDAPPEVVRAAYDIGSAGFLVASPGFAAMLICAFMVSKATGALPAWLNWVALASGIFFLLQLLTLLSDEGDNLFGMFYPLGFLGLVIFTIGTSLIFNKRIE